MIEPTSQEGVSKTLYLIGKQYDKMDELPKARQYYDLAIKTVLDRNTPFYRDVLVSKALCDYQTKGETFQSLSFLRWIIAQTDDENEHLTRSFAIGAIFCEEGVYDSALYYLIPVFQKEEKPIRKLQAVEYLRIAFDSLGNKEKSDECLHFLAVNKTSEGQNKALVSTLEDVFTAHMIQEKSKRDEKVRKDFFIRTVGIVMPIVVVTVCAIIVVAKRKSKKLLKQQQEETDKVLGEMEQEYAEERDSLRQDLEEREAQVISLEKALNQQHIEAQQQRAAFIKEPICQHILGKVRNKHITTRDNAYELGIALGDEEFMLLGAAVAKHYDGFDHKLLSRCASLKPNDLTLCHLSFLGLGEVAIAALKNRTYSAIKKQKESVEKKLGVEGDLSVYVLSVAEGVSVGQIEEKSKKSTLKSMSEGTLKGIQKQIVDIIVNNPNVTISLVASQLGRNPRGIARHFKTLQDKGVICRVGPDRGGHWEVVG